MNKLNEIQHEALLRVQWSGNRGDAKGDYCPVCEGYRGYASLDQSGLAGHQPSCAVGIAIQSFKDAKTALLLMQSTAPGDRGELSDAWVDSQINAHARKIGL